MSNLETLPELPWQVPAEVLEKAAQIKLALFDVDGVLTDGSLHYGSDGEELKTFNALDGHGLKMLGAVGVTVGVISARKSKALERRLTDLGIAHQHLGVSDKVSVFDSLLQELKINAEQAAFTGDDVIDLPVMQQCGLKFSVHNGHFIVKHFADWVTPQAGGAGAVRAVCDTLLYSQGEYPLGRHTQQ